MKNSKYEKLLLYLKSNDRENYALTFDEIATILGFELDHSFLKYKSEASGYGYEVGKIHLKQKCVDFAKLAVDR